MKRLHRLFHTEVSSCRVQVIVVCVPDQAWPRVTAHPLYNAGGRMILAQAISFHHGPMCLVVLGLSFGDVVFYVNCFPVAPLERVIKNFRVTKSHGTTMIFPGGS